VIPDIPDGLVGNDNLAPVLDLVGNSLELLGDDLDGGAGLTLLKALTAAQMVRRSEWPRMVQLMPLSLS
jgi:hypothetical protein